MPHSRAQQVQAGRLGGHAAQARMTPEQRRELARKGHLVSAVKAVVDRAPELTDDQKARIRAVLADAPGREPSG